jgi:HAMP domain-containing protein
MNEESARDSQKDSTRGGADRRTLKGMLVRPRQQLRFTFLFMGGGMLVLTLFIGVIMFSLNRTLVSLELAYGLDPEMAATIRSSLNTTMGITFMLSAVLAAFSFILGIQMSHRIFGPIVPIVKHVEELSAGRYSSRIKLRESDEFKEVQDALNSLAEKLDSAEKAKRA